MGDATKGNAILQEKGGGGKRRKERSEMKSVVIIDLQSSALFFIYLFFLLCSNIPIAPIVNSQSLKVYQQALGCSSGVFHLHRECVCTVC